MRRAAAAGCCELQPITSALLVRAENSRNDRRVYRDPMSELLGCAGAQATRAGPAQEHRAGRQIGPCDASRLESRRPRERQRRLRGDSRIDLRQEESMRSLASVLVASLVVAVLGAPAARAQCYEWSDRFQSNGVTGGYVAAQCEHDDGSGGGPKLYVGGSFTKLAGVDASSIAEWDGVQWRSLSSNTSGVIEALVSFDDGNGAALYAAGSFTSIGGVAADNIAKWDGTHWSPLAGGLDNLATSLAVYDDGSGPALFVGGWFS